MLRNMPHSSNNMFPPTHKKKGDLVTHVDGEAISGMSASEVSEEKDGRGRGEVVGIWGLGGCLQVSCRCKWSDGDDERDGEMINTQELRDKLIPLNLNPQPER